MSAFLNSLRADLLDRRLRAVLILFVAALVGGVAYAVTGGSGSPAAPSSFPAIGSSAPGVAPVVAAANPNLAVAETTSGAPQQRAGASRNPFTPLPGAGAKAASSTSASGKSSTGSSSKSSSPSSGKEVPPTQPAKKRVVIHFHSSAEFGVVPPAPAPGVAPPAPQLKKFTDLKLNEPLPNKANSQLVYLGVVLRTGKAAVFGLTGEVILHGSAKCLPSPVHCQAIELQVGQSETLESIEANGTPVTYELKLVSISRSVTSASAARAHTAATGAAELQRELLRELPAGVLAGVRDSHGSGVLSAPE
jgi:hypothetical protein